MAEDALSFETHIKPLFRELDRDAMMPVFDLWAYDEVKEFSARILERLDNGTMPCDAPWPEEQISLFEAWIAQDMQA